MKNLIAVVAVIILGIAVGGIIVGFSSTADNIGTQADALGQGLISEDGQWLGAIGSGPEAPGVPQEPDPYEGMGVISIDELGAAVIGTLYENGDLVVSGSGAMKDYANANDAPFGTSGNPNTSIKKVIIKDGVTTVGNYAFYNCSGLTSVTIPDSVTSIGQYAFYNCSSLTSVYFQGNAPDDYGTNIFKDTPSTLKVYRKDTATGWGPTWGDPSREVVLWED
jgi:hypothetical protein